MSFLIFFSIFSPLAHCDPKPDEIPVIASIQEKLDTQLDLDAVFTDSSGQTAPLRNFLVPHRPFLIVPVYFECPRLCPLTTQGVLNAINEAKLRLGTDFTVLMMSFDSAETTANAEKAAKKNHPLLSAEQLAGQESWHFLTGSEENIQRITDALGFHFAKDGTEFVHAAVTVVATPEGRISSYLFGIRYDPKDFNLALVEASQGKIGSTFDKVLLYCFHFDPTTGKYSLVIMNVLRGVSLIVLLLLFGSLLIMRLREMRSVRHV